MNKEQKLKEIYGTRGGWKVPEGYFDSVFKEISDKLPEYNETPKERTLTTWQRLKPYTYLAAMFAGIWLMMNMFHHVSENAVRLNLDNPPEQIAQAMMEPEVTDLFLSHSASEADFTLEDEICTEYSSIEEFEKDFFSE